MGKRNLLPDFLSLNSIMKNVFLAAFLLLAVRGFAQQPAKPGKNSDGMVTLVCNIVGAAANADSITVYDQEGLGYRPLYRGARRLSDSAYVVQVPMPATPRFYSIGLFPNQVGRIIVGEGRELQIYANAMYMDRARTVKSSLNEGYYRMKRRVDQFRDEREALRQQLLQQTAANTSGATSITARIAGLDKAKSSFLDSLKTASPLLWRAATTLVAPEYLHQTPRKTDAEYLGADYFAYANFADPAYENMPDVFTAFEIFAQNIMGAGLPNEKAQEVIDKQLARVKPGSRTYRQALGGVVSTFRGSQHPLYPVYARKYLAAFRGSSYGEMASLELDIRRSASFIIGMEAPELAGMTPDSQTYALSKMRGKIVLIDFWASWCGPCIREMPTVRTVYQKYKDQGFDILGVSLDREPKAWTNAISQHMMPWHHISDLKGWQSEYAQLYSVQSIPQTILVDREGKIMARNLRGAELEGKLAEIFGK